MKALILVDIQNDFMPGGPLAVPQGEQVPPVANRVQPYFDFVVASQDWHPPDHGSFAANCPGRKVGEFIELGGVRQILWPVHCVQKTRGAELVSDLDVSRVREVFRKGTDPEIDSYSAFFDNGHKQATGLGDYLQANSVEHVYLLGLALDVCVKFSALDARRLGFRITLIEDGCRAVEVKPGDGERALEEMRSAGVELASSEEITSQGPGP